MSLFGFLKSDPAKKLQKQYAQLMETAMQVQRSGDLRAYAQKIEEAEAVQAEIEKLKLAGTE